MKEIFKKLAVIILIILMFICATCAPVEPEGEVVPYMSDIVYIPQKVSAKGKAKTSVKKRLSYEYEKLGKFTLTAYCSCAKCCGSYAGGTTATGVKAKANHTIAVDPKVIPYGTTVMIKGKLYVAEDCGSGIKGKHIDIFFDNHSDALEFGRQKANVYKIKLKGRVKKCKLSLKSKTFRRIISLTLYAE